jgi:hypothetical protein
LQTLEPRGLEALGGRGGRFQLMEMQDHALMITRGHQTRANPTSYASQTRLARANL